MPELALPGDGSQTKAPDDSVTIDLATRRISHFVARDSGVPALAARIREFAQGERHD